MCASHITYMNYSSPIEDGTVINEMADDISLNISHSTAFYFTMTLVGCHSTSQDVLGFLHFVQAMNYKLITFCVFTLN